MLTGEICKQCRTVVEHWEDECGNESRAEVQGEATVEGFQAPQDAIDTPGDATHLLSPVKGIIKGDPEIYDLASELNLNPVEVKLDAREGEIINKSRTPHKHCFGLVSIECEEIN
jgi:hypothetical protein